MSLQSSLSLSNPGPRAPEAAGNSPGLDTGGAKNYEIGEMSSVPGSPRLFSNGYRDEQLYVYNATAI